ncbi:MAG: hypothetical protein CFE24_02375 [Flavobacterium sp. BFFFF2]|nr:MAG: hypothetical protein CFE24_02375 [Flavobacterium sp. BFFFF2]
MRYWGLLIIFFWGCQQQPGQKTDTIARVGDSYLLKSDLKGIVPAGTTKEDSLLLVKNYAEHWALQKLMLEAAEKNTSDKQLQEFEKLVKQYKNDLLTSGYLEQLVQTSIDTTITEQELKAYYDKNKQNFRTNGSLVRLRYLHLASDNPKFGIIRSKFYNFQKKDKKFWDIHSLQCYNFAFNDSVWVEMNQVYSKLPFVNPDNRDQYIRSGNSFDYTEGKTRYFVKVKQVLDKNQVCPFNYIEPTLKEIVINQRKLMLIKKLEKEMVEDAIKNKTYEYYP